MIDDPLHLLVDALRRSNPAIGLAEAVEAVEMPLARAVEASLATVNHKLDQLTSTAACRRSGSPPSFRPSSRMPPPRPAPGSGAGS